MRLGRRLGLAALATALAAPAPGADFSLDLRGGWTHLTSASDSAEAVLGSAGGTVWGGGVGVVFADRFAATLSLRRFEENGERVFVTDPPGEVFPLGHPLTLKLTPVLLSLTYRFSPDAFVTPYAGLGGGFVSFEETSTVGGITERENATHGELHALAGLELGPGRFRFGIELQYSTVPDAIGVGGVSALYGENNLGGFTALARLVFITGR